MPKSVAIQSVCLACSEASAASVRAKPAAAPSCSDGGAQLMQGGTREAAAERRIDLGHAKRERAHLLGQRLGFGDGAPQMRKLLHVGREHGEVSCS